MSGTLVWFRRDLRTHDNPALWNALSSGEKVVPVFIWAPDEEAPWAPGAASRWWLHHSLISLSEDLAKLGLELKVISAASSLEALRDFVKSEQLDRVYWNRRYEPKIVARDTDIKSALKSDGLVVESFNSHLLFEPWTVQTKTGAPYQVYTPFWKSTGAVREVDPPLGEPQAIGKAAPTKKTIQRIAELGLLPNLPWDQDFPNHFQPGATSAKKNVLRFLKENVEDYDTARDFPATPGTSKISAHLSWGELSPRWLWFELENYRSGDGLERWRKELVWREFAYHLLHHFPQTTESPLRRDFERFPWANNPQQLIAWQKGLTGYPIVDAGMRELWTTGWMHNRVRMIVASFLVKHLQLSWQEGARWFWDTLVDADLANNTLGWQWAAGCGADAAPYFRIFNPTLQGEKFDSDGRYTKKWVPELAKTPNDLIHRPWEGPRVPAYPAPLVDHAKARNLALKAFESLKK